VVSLLCLHVQALGLIPSTGEKKIFELIVVLYYFHGTFNHTQGLPVSRKKLNWVWMVYWFRIQTWAWHQT
jgi:hypothetical protein